MSDAREDRWSTDVADMPDASAVPAKPFVSEAAVRDPSAAVTVPLNRSAKSLLIES